MHRRNMIIGGSALLLAGAGIYGWRHSVGSMAIYADQIATLRAKLPWSPICENRTVGQDMRCRAG